MVSSKIVLPGVAEKGVNTVQPGGTVKSDEPTVRLKVVILGL